MSARHETRRLSSGGNYGTFDGDVPRGTADRIDRVRAIAVKGLLSQELDNHDSGVRNKSSFKPQDERSDSWGHSPHTLRNCRAHPRAWSQNWSFFRSATCSKIRPSNERNHSTQAGNTDVSRPQRRGMVELHSPCFTPSHRTTHADFHHPSRILLFLIA
jgi:hypothetical protein